MDGQWRSWQTCKSVGKGFFFLFLGQEKGFKNPTGNVFSPLDEVQKVKLALRNLDRLQFFLFQLCCIFLFLRDRLRSPLM